MILSTFKEPGNSETRKGLDRRSNRRETKWDFDSLKTLWERRESRWGCYELTGELETRGPSGQVQGVSLGGNATAHFSPGCKSGVL